LPTYNNQALADLLLGDAVDYEHDKLCTPETLCHFINSSKSLRLQRYGLGEIIKQFCTLKGFSGRGAYMYLQQTGICANELVQWAKTYGNEKVNVYCIDPANRMFLNYRCGAQHSLVVKINNDHTYLVSDKSIKQSVIQNGKVPRRRVKETAQAEDILVVENTAGLVDAIVSSAKRTIIVANNWKTVLSNYVSQSGTMISQLNGSENEVSAFVCPISRKAVFIREDHARMFHMYRQLQRYKTFYPDLELPTTETQYKGQTIGNLCIALTTHVVGAIPSSHYNRKVLDYLDSFLYPRLVETYEFEEGVGEKGAYDISKAYSYGRTNMLGDIPVYSIHDTIQPYDGGEIQVGKYRLRSFYMFRNKHIYIPEGFYTHGFVRKCLDYGLITKDCIVEQYLAKTGLSKHLLEEMTTFIFRVFAEKDA
jgi:hypothetical protein